jgi:hypothetical protein
MFSPARIKSMLAHHWTEHSMPLDHNFEQIAGPLGHFLIEFNYLEVDIGRLIARMLKQDDMVAAVFAAQLIFGAKLKLAETLIPLKVGFDLDLQNRASAVVRAARTVNEERNSFIHSEYLPVLDAKDNLLEVLKKKIRDSAKVLNVTDGETIDALLQPVNAEALKALADRANATALEMRKVAELICDTFPDL